MPDFRFMSATTVRLISDYICSGINMQIEKEGSISSGLTAACDSV